MQQSPAISVIIPVYNKAPWLRRCLDSVCRQTLKNIEIICINDGSTDDSGTILDEYAKQDSRILLIELARNQGVSRARNIGLEAAQGEWLGFVDSDDSIAPDFYEKLYAQTSSGNAEIIKGIRWSERDAPQYINKAFNDRIRKNKLVFTYEWTSAIYKSSFIKSHDISFINGCTNSEDVAFLYEAVLCCTDIRVIDDAVYNYYLIDNSANTEKLSLKKIKNNVNAISTMINLINIHLYNNTTYISEYIRWIFCCMDYLRRCELADKEAALRFIAESLITFVSKCREKERVLTILHDRHSALSTLIDKKDIEKLALALRFIAETDPRKSVCDNLRSHMAKKKLLQKPTSK